MHAPSTGSARQREEFITFRYKITDLSMGIGPAVFGLGHDGEPRVGAWGRGVMERKTIFGSREVSSYSRNGMVCH